MIGLAEPKKGESSGSSEDAYLKEAFSALKDEDEAGFVSAMKAFKSCSKKAAESDDEDEE
jgi:hypothetical protein